MTPRENLIEALCRRNPQWVPFEFRFSPALEQEFQRRTGQKHYEDYYNFDIRTVRLPATKHPNDYSSYFKSLPQTAWIDEWGVGHLPGSVAHFDQFLHPMADFESPKEVYDFPLPDVLADYRWMEVEKQVRHFHERGLACRFSQISIFERSWYLRGLDNLLCDLLTDEEMAEACLKRMTDNQIAMARRAAQSGVDIITFGDDVGTQRGMMLSRPLWVKWLKPRLRAAIAAAKEENPQVLAYYHSDGKIEEIIEDLIEVGVDILNPVQPECMDPVAIKRQYGDRLSFWGTIGTQTTMPFGSPQEVEETVKRMIQTVGKNGGFCLAPSHLLEPEVPYENVEALVRAVKKYGRYLF